MLHGPIIYDDFTDAYVDAALWSSTGDDGVPLDDRCTPPWRCLAPETLARMVADCRQFQTANADDIGAGSGSAAGHDFWLTRCGHGAGFWDGDWPEPAATRLTDAAHRAGHLDLYAGDDGLVYLI